MRHKPSFRAQDYQDLGFPEDEQQSPQHRAESLLELGGRGRRTSAGGVLGQGAETPTNGGKLGGVGRQQLERLPPERD